MVNLLISGSKKCWRANMWNKEHNSQGSAHLCFTCEPWYELDKIDGVRWEKVWNPSLPGSDKLGAGREANENPRDGQYIVYFRAFILSLLCLKYWKCIILKTIPYRIGQFKKSLFLLCAKLTHTGWYSETIGHITYSQTDTCCKGRALRRNRLTSIVVFKILS